MSGVGGGAGGVQPPGSSGSGSSDQVGKAAQKGMPGSEDAAKGDPSAGGAGDGAGAGASPAKDPAGGSGGSDGGGSSGLGAGGTSKASKGGSESDMSTVAKGAGAAAAVPAVGAAAQLMIFAMFLKWLKSVMAAMAAAVMNLMSLLWTMAVAVTQAVVGAALAVGAAVASAVGGAISAVTGAASVGAAALAVVGLIAGAVQAVTGNNSTAQRDGLPPDCRPETEATVSQIDDNSRSEHDTEAMEEMAEEVYEILAGWGMPDENIAGVLGNFEGESNIDPTTVETIYDESYEVGPKTQDAWDNDFKIDLIDSDYAAEYPAIDLAGIGLGQWTNDRNTMLLEYADETGGEWHELETQFEFMMAGDYDYRVEVVQDLIDDPSGSIDESTQTWQEQWEGLTNQPAEVSKRQGYAATWFAKMDSWEADEDRADSILDQADTSLDLANQNHRNAVIQNCRTANVDGGSGEVIQAGEQIPCANLGSMHPDACDLHDHLQDEFGGFFLSAGGQRHEPGSNHHNGQAIDYMMAPENEVPSDEMRESGTTVVNYLVANAEEFNISGILWYEAKWATGNDPVGEWDEDGVTRDASGRGSNTQNHIDHIHVSVGPDEFK